MILFITDGDIGYERNVFNIVDSYLGKSRLFSIETSSSATLAERPRISSAGALLMDRVDLLFRSSY